jgi:hypothetical protein
MFMQNASSTFRMIELRTRQLEFPSGDGSDFWGFESGFACGNETTARNLITSKSPIVCCLFSAFCRLSPFGRLTKKSYHLLV